MNKMKLNIPVFAALILLLLTMVTTHITSGLYARYVATATGTSDMQVAKFDITADVDNSTGNYIVTVYNGSEVTVEYDIIVEYVLADAQLSNHFTTDLDGVKKTPAAGVTSVTFEGGELAAGASSADMPLNFEIANWADLTRTDQNSGASETVKFDFNVKIEATQKD